jgi:hypothetical protein
MTALPQDADFHNQLQRLAVAAGALPARSVQRRQTLNELIRRITASNRLWRENTPYYEDALQQTWLYVCRNIDKYDPEKSSVIHWIDQHLKWRLKDGYIQKAEQAAKTATGFATDATVTTDPIGQLVAPPDIPPILEETRQWVEADPDGELRRLSVYRHPACNCQVLLLRRLPPETSWQAIAAEFDLPPSTPPNFYQRNCLPRLRNFARHQGYLDSEAHSES